MSAIRDVAIVGAGAAGIAAARRLHAAGRDVVLIEASARVGGRACTHDLDGMPLDLGCGWLHSAARNPLVPLAEAAGFQVDRSPAAWGAQYRDLGFPPDRREAAWRSWEALHVRLHDAPPSSDRAADALAPGDPWNAHHDALSGYMNGASLADLSVRDYLAYEDAAGDENWRVAAGYGTLLAALLPPVPLHLATPVTAIDHGGAHVRLETRAGTVIAKAAIVTISSAVLAAGALRLSPAADGHLHAASGLPLGVAEKLYLGLAPGHGLPPEAHLLGNAHRAETGSYYLRPLARPVIECFFGGAGARALAAAGPGAMIAFAADELAALLGAGIRSKLCPLVASDWCRADWIRGSYSHALPGRRDARATLAAPLGERVVFAGEATHPADFSTAHGAWESGIRAADMLLSR